MIISAWTQHGFAAMLFRCDAVSLESPPATLYRSRFNNSELFKTCLHHSNAGFYSKSRGNVLLGFRFCQLLKFSGVSSVKEIHRLSSVLCVSISQAQLHRGVPSAPASCYRRGVAVGTPRPGAVRFGPPAPASAARPRTNATSSRVQESHRNLLTPYAHYSVAHEEISRGHSSEMM